MTYVKDPAERLRATQEAQAASAAHLGRIVDNPAAVFDKAARTILSARGERAPSSAVARLVGVSPPQWNTWTQGHKSPTYGAIVGWLVKWETAGYPPITLTITSAGTVSSTVL